MGSAGRRATPWGAEVERFLRTKAEESAPGEAWIRRMRWELTRFPRLLRRLGASQVPRSIRDLTEEAVLSVRKGMGWEKATFAIHFAALRQFARWAGNPVALRGGVWRLPSGQPTHRRWLTREQLSLLLRSAEGKEKLLVALEGLNGLRRVEVLRLRQRDLLLDEGCLRVLGKGRHGGKWRQIPMHPVVRTLLTPFRGEVGAEDRLFAMSATGADLLLRRAALRAGFEVRGLRVSHHDLRRTFGRLAHDSGVDLVQLKNLLGHASIEMTVHYIGLDLDRMRKGLELVALAEGTVVSP